MKKIIIVVVALLLVFLNVAPVAAKSESGVFIKVKGEMTLQLSEVPGYELEDAVGKVTLTIDSVSGEAIMEIKFGRILWPHLGTGFPEEQWITGMYSEGELTGFKISEDGSTITLFTGPAQVRLLPSGNLVGTEPATVGTGTITGKTVSFELEDDNVTILTGKIKIK